MLRQFLPRLVWGSLLATVFWMLPLGVQAQDTLQSADLSSPYTTVRSHLWFLQSGEAYKPAEAAKTLPVGTENAQELAIQLKQILDGKGLRVALSQLPRNADFKDSIANENIYVLFPKELPNVYLEKVGDEWRYSAATVGLIPELHREVYPFGTDILIGLIPQVDEYKILGLRVWQYIGVAALLLLIWILHQITSYLLRIFIGRVLKNRLKRIDIDKKLVLRMARLVSHITMVWIAMRLLPILQFEVQLLAAIIVGLKIMRTVFVVLLLFRVADLLTFAVSKVTEKTESTLDDQILPLLKQALYIVIGVVGTFLVLNLLNVNVAALIAGISIGGLALALAAQDTVKNLIGSVMIFVDRPFQIGDFISVAGVTGTVEMVGFRSTRIRTFSNSVTSVPNSIIANAQVDNLGLRVYRRYKTSFTLTYGTPPAKIEEFIDRVRAIIAAHPNVRNEGNEVHFNSMSSSSLDVLMVLFYEVNTWSDELKTTHDILMDVLKMANEIGVSFAFPSTSVYIEQQAPSDDQ